MGIGALVWAVISIVVAIGGGFALYFTYLRKSNDGKFTGFWGWMYDFLSFKKLLVENVLRITYLILAIFVTLGSFTLISESFLMFLGVLIGGNFVLRIVYEWTILALLLCKNTTEINSKMNK